MLLHTNNNMAEQTTTIKLIMDKLHRNPLLSDITLETVVDYTVDFMRIVGTPRLFQDKVIELTVADYKTLLPVDWYENIQIRYGEEIFRYSSDTFHLSRSTNNMPTTEITFVVQGGYIHTSIESGTIELSYRAIETDDMGYPLLPDNSNFTRALEAYVKQQYFTILFDLGKISSQVYSNAQQQYAWAVGALETDMQRLDLSKAETFFNSYSTLLLRRQQFQRGFKGNGDKV